MNVKFVVQQTGTGSNISTFSSFLIHLAHVLQVCVNAFIYLLTGRN